MSRKEAPRPGLLKAALAGRMTNAEGARALGISVRQFQRLKQRFQADGVDSVPHALRGRPSNRRVPAALSTQIATLMRTTYERFNDVHFTEKLREVHKLPVSRASVRRLRVALGIPPQRPRRAPPHRSRRPRAEAVGRLVQLDGSPFAWLEDRGPAFTLLGAIDDATSRVVALWPRPPEDLHGYTTLLEHLCRTPGLPVALYGDRLNVFIRNDRHWSLDEQLAGTQTPTHFGRMLADLGIGFIAAQSPQAKGRIERLWGTLQDRLVSELRLRGVATLEAVIAFLPEFIADHNRRFAAPTAGVPTVWRPAPRDLARLLSCRSTRIVARDNTVTLGPRVVQLPPRGRGRSGAGRRLDVRELLDGRLLVLADGVLLVQQAPPADFCLIPRQARRADDRRHPAPPPSPPTHAPRSVTPPSPPSPKPGRRPAQTHPWLASLRRHVALKELRETLRPARG